MSKSPQIKSKPKSANKNNDDLPLIIESSHLKPAREADHTLDIEAVREDALREVPRNSQPFVSIIHPPCLNLEPGQTPAARRRGHVARAQAHKRLHRAAAHGQRAAPSNL